MKTILKIVKWLFIGLIILIGLLLGFTQTAIFRNQVRKLAERVISKQLNGTLSIGKLEGNFFRSLRLQDVAIVQHNDTILGFQELNASWGLSPLLRKEIRIGEVRLVRPQLFLKQLPDSSWNVAHLFSPAEKEPVEPEPQPFTCRIFFPAVELADGALRFETGNSNLPKKIQEINLKINGAYQQDELSVHLGHFSLRTSEPSMEIRQISFQLLLKGEVLDLRNLEVKTAQNDVAADLKLNMEDLSGLELSLKTAPLVPEEFSHWIGDPGLAAHPEVTLDSRTENDTLKFAIRLLNTNEQHQLEGYLGSWQRVVSGKQDSLRFALQTELNGFDLASWLKEPGLKLNLTSKMELDGNSFDLKTGKYTLYGTISQLQAEGRDLGETELAGTLVQGNLQLNLKSAGRFGRIALQSSVDSVFSTPVITAHSVFSDLNLAPLLLNDSLVSDLNLALDIRQFNPKKQTGVIRVAADSSSVAGIPIDSLRLVAKGKSKSATIDTLLLALPGANFSARGTMNRDSVFVADWSVQVREPSKIPFIPVTGKLEAKADVAGVAEGKINRFGVDASLRIRDLVYNELLMKSLDGKVKVQMQPSGLNGESIVEIRQVQNNGLTLDSTKISAGFTEKGVTADIDLFVADTLESHLAAWASWEDVFKIGIPRLLLTMNDVTWDGQLDSLVMDTAAFEINNFSLFAPADSNQVQSIALDGLFSLEGEEDLRLRLDRITIGTITKMLGARQSMRGEINSQFHLKGSALSPELEGNLSVTKMGYNGYNLGEMSGPFHFRNEQFTLNLNWLPLEKNALELNADLPVEFSPARQKYGLLTDSLFSVSVKTADFPLANLAYPVRDMMQLNGTLQADLIFGNTIKNPQLHGFLKIPHGTIEVPDYGIRYRDLYLYLSANGTLFTLDSLNVQRDKGWLRAKGTLDLGDSLLAGKIVSNQLSLKANDFYVVKHKDYEVEIKGDIEFKSDTTSAFGGGIVIQRSKFNVPAIISTYKKIGGASADAPLLVQALENQENSQLTTISDSIPIKKDGSSLMKDLRGKFTLEIPRNTWLTSPEGSIEISGELEVIKEGEDFQLFGPLEIVRGHYDLYGRRFKFEEGRLDFTGNYNPNLDFIVEYTFRNPDRKKQVLSAYVTGNALSPVLEFKLDDEQITEGDAISYIAFGKSLNNLSYSEQSSVNENTDAGALAGKLAANVVSKQLTKLLGNAFAFDLVELKAESDWRSAAFLVGKYITNDLFVSYQKSFGNLEDDDITPEIITLEYELTKFLFLQLVESDSRESGIDLFFKFEKGKKKIRKDE